MFDKRNLLKILGVVAAAVGVIATLATDWVNEQKMSEEIEERVNEALAVKEENNEVES